MTAATVAMELLRSVSDQYYPARHASAGTREPADHIEEPEYRRERRSARLRSPASARIRRPHWSAVSVLPWTRPASSAATSLPSAQRTLVRSEQVLRRARLRVKRRVSRARSPGCCPAVPCHVSGRMPALDTG